MILRKIGGKMMRSLKWYKLSDPILSEDEGTRIIEDFAKKHSYFGFKKN